MLFITPGGPWENRYIESFNGKRRDEYLNGDLFLNLAVARITVDRRRMDNTHHRLHNGGLEKSRGVRGVLSLVRAICHVVQSPDSAMPHPSERTIHGWAGLVVKVVQKSGLVIRLI